MENKPHKNSDKSYTYPAGYFAKKMRESRARNKPYFYIEVDGKKYLFRKDKMSKIKPKQIDDSCVMVV